MHPPRPAVRRFTAGPVAVLPEVDLPDVYLPAKTARLAFLHRESGGGR